MDKEIPGRVKCDSRQNMVNVKSTQIMFFLGILKTHLPLPLIFGKVTSPETLFVTLLVSFMNSGCSSLYNFVPEHIFFQNTSQYMFAFLFMLLPLKVIK